MKFTVKRRPGKSHFYSRRWNSKPKSYGIRSETTPTPLGKTFLLEEVVAKWNSKPKSYEIRSETTPTPLKKTFLLEEIVAETLGISIPLWKFELFHSIGHFDKIVNDWEDALKVVYGKEIPFRIYTQSKIQKLWGNRSVNIILAILGKIWL